MALDEFRLRERRRNMPLGARILPKPRDPQWMIVISLLVATVLTVYPVPYGWVSLRPLWLVMVALFWVLYQPAWCGVWFAFAVGLCADLLLDLQLGGQAFALVVVVSVVRILIQNRRVLTFANGWVLSTASVVMFMLINLVLQKLMGRQLSLTYWLSGLSSVLLWPLLYAGLQKWRA